MAHGGAMMGAAVGSNGVFGVPFGHAWARGFFHTRAPPIRKQARRAAGAYAQAVANPHSKKKGSKFSINNPARAC